MRAIPMFLALILAGCAVAPPQLDIKAHRIVDLTWPFDSQTLVTAKSAADPDYRLTSGDVLQWEARNGRIARGSIVLLRTGWARFWPDGKAYFGGESAQALHFPSYGAEAARLLVEERGVTALGIDTASIDHGPSRDFAVHRIASAANVPGLENLANLGELPERGALVIALPMKIAGGSGAPLRIVALVPK